MAVPYWVKLVREDCLFSAYYSADGVSWTLLGTETITMPPTVYIGVAGTSRIHGVLGQMAVDNLIIN